jgi:hypothetical protein
MAKKKGKKYKAKEKEELEEETAEIPQEQPQESEVPSEPTEVHGGLSFLEKALKTTKKSKKALESFILEKVEVKEESEEVDESEFVPQLKSENVPAIAETPEQIEADLAAMSQAIADLEAMDEDTTIETPLPEAPAEPALNVYEKLGSFFEELITSFSERYHQWENSTGLILTILRKMRKITKKNTEQLINTIEEGHQKIKDGFNDFAVKKQEIEKASGSDFSNISKDFSKILGLLELQVQEYQLKKTVSELFFR